MKIDVPFIAAICHEANRQCCRMIGDHSQVPWEQAAAWQRLSACKGVEYRLANPDATPEAQHEAWCEDKFADGWSYGGLKDPLKKEHPCLRPYHELPEHQQFKDTLFVAVVDSLKGLL